MSAVGNSSEWDQEYSHMSVDDPFQILFSFLRAARATLDPPEKARVPLNRVLCPLGGLVSLLVLHLGLLVGSKLVVAFLHCLGCFVPEFLRLSLVLLLKWSNLRR